ncbi:MAG TPA: hypothetical protein VFY40_26105, partial [Blastocatellia bacterium]|nr:hypothetical protein [Blastocatellia bacterium]
GATFLMRERAANKFIFASLFGNPADMARVACLMILDGKEVFGAAGAALVKFMGGERASLLLLLGGLIIWIVVPFLLAQRSLEKQDI